MKQEFYWPYSEVDTYWAFGDGSEHPAGASYGFVLIPRNEVEGLQQRLSDLKVQFGGARTDRIHCREIFSGHQRKKSCWSHLSGDECGQLVTDALTLVDTVRPSYVYTHWPRVHFPKRFRLRGRNGFGDIVHSVNDKWMVLWSFLNTVVLFDPSKIVEPPNPVVVAQPKSRPYWRFGANRSGSGPVVEKIFLDREETRVNWFSKSFQWETIATEAAVKTPRGESVLPIVGSDRPTHMLVDVADIFVYSVTRQLAGLEPLRFTAPSAEPYVLLRGAPTEEFVLG
jgi:hypothetical protein